MSDELSFSKGSTDMSASIAREAKGIVRCAAAPVSPGEGIKAQMTRAWKELGRPAWWRLRAAWYGEAGSWSAVAMDDLRERERRRSQRIASASASAVKLAEQYLTAAARLESIDAEFYSENIEGLRALARTLGQRSAPGVDVADARGPADRGEG